MTLGKSYRIVDLGKLGEIERLAQSPLHIRWGVAALAVFLACAQAVINLSVEARGAPFFLAETQVPAITFGMFFLLCLFLNPLLRLTRIVRPLNTGELMAVFAAMFVSAGVSALGLVDYLIPLIVTPFNQEWNTPQREWDVAIIPHLNKNLFITDAKIIEQFRTGFDTTEGLWGRIPWQVWAKPIALWLIFVFAVYLAFYSLSILVYDTWARREKIVFPLARLPQYLVRDEGAEEGQPSSTLRSGLFWIAVGGVSLFMLYNAACAKQWLGTLKPLDLEIEQYKLMSMLSHTGLKGIAESDAVYMLVVCVSFTAVGIGYLLPLEVSRSLWSYHLLGIFMLLAAIWCKVGADARSFPSDELWQNNFLSSLGAGGLLAFSAAVLGKLIHEKGALLSEKMPWKQKWALLKPFAGGAAMFSLAIIIALIWLAWAGVSVVWGLCFLAVIVLLTIGLMRVVAEGGIHLLHIHAGPFHLVKVLGLVKTIPSAVLAVLLPVYSAVLYDPRTCIAPSILNAFKVQEESRAARRRFHLIVITSIVVTVLVSCTALIYFTYIRGADRSKGTYFTETPTRIFESTRRLVSGDIGLEHEPHWIAWLAGGTWVAVSLAARRRLFWWPHPIGFVMLVNPLMRELWLSFFIGWFCKRTAVRYGGRHMFAQLRPFFIGLIIGELTAYFLIVLFLNPPQFRF